MAFLEQRLSQKIERGATGGPRNDGRKRIVSNNGRMRQIFEWDAPAYQFEASHGYLTAEDFESMRAMWYVVNFTPYDGFRWRDWTDYKLLTTNTELVFITGSTWQLYRLYTYAGITFRRKITKPAVGVTCYRFRDPDTTTPSFTVDTVTGIFTISGHVSGDTYTAEGAFDVPVTFADNEWIASLESGPAGPVPVAPSVKLIEVSL